jgi:hypothetical protein
VSELSTVARQIVEQAKTLAVKAEASGDQPSERELEAIKQAIDRLQRGLNRIQTETDAWADEPVEV